MADDLVVLRSARNAYLVLLLLLFLISSYQFVTIGGITEPITVLWIAAAVVYYGSRWYYGRSADADAAAES